MITAPTRTLRIGDSVFIGESKVTLRAVDRGRATLRIEVEKKTVVLLNKRGDIMQRSPHDSGTSDATTARQGSTRVAVNG